jgi:hypothetical protein
LVDKYNKNDDYTISLENRDVQPFKIRQLFFGPITIPNTALGMIKTSMELILCS